MSFNFYGKSINQTLQKLFLAGALTVFFALTTAAQVGIVKFDYEYKSNAQGKLKAELNRGNKARMFWNAAIKRWTVEVDYGNGDADETESNADTDDEETNSTSETRTIIYQYEYKSNAEGKLRAERNRGKTARMFYDSSVRRWTVEVEEPVDVTGTDSDDTTTTVLTTKSKVNTDAEVGSSNLPNGATVSYFPDKEMAEGIYRAALKQGDWTKMWYDEKRRAWAVAIKVR